MSLCYRKLHETMRTLTKMTVLLPYTAGTLTMQPTYSKGIINKRDQSLAMIGTLMIRYEG